MRAGAPKPPPPPSGADLVSWSQLYRYLDNPFDVMLFTLAVLGCLGSGAYPSAARPRGGPGALPDGGPTRAAPGAPGELALRSSTASS